MNDVELKDVALIVDDTPETLSVLTDALEEAGLTVLIACDGQTALGLVERITPDIILLDAVMPGLDGFELCRRLKRNSALADIPVIFMTGLSETESVVKGLKAGGVDYLTKPIAPDELIARIGVHLANARLWRSTRTAIDSAGRSLLAVTTSGEVIWASPKATTLLREARLVVANDNRIRSDEIVGWIKSCTNQPTSTIAAKQLKLDDTADLVFSLVTKSGPDEMLFHISKDSGATSEDLLHKELGLTMREAEVLSWLSRGKSNRDIAEILSLSPRTINKHLEQVYAKLGVENRTAAAAVAIKLLVET